MFRKLSQEPDETLAQFLARLRNAAVGCGYTDVDSEIRDQIVSACGSDKLRLKLLEKSSKLTLAKCLTIAATLEAVELQLKEMTIASNSNVNRAGFNMGGGGKHMQGHSDPHASFSDGISSQNSGVTTRKPCGRCGKTHKPRECPAWGKQCFKCNGKNHFQNMCRSKLQANAITDTNNSEVESVKSKELDSKPGFSFCNIATANKVSLKRTTLSVGGVPISFVIDTGADCNTLGKSNWEKLRASNVSVTKQEAGCGPDIYTYSSDTPIKVMGQFWADVQGGSSQKTLKDVRFIVISENAESLLGIDTATALGAVKFANAVLADYESKFPNLFSFRIGKADKQISLSIRDDVEPIAQPYRRVALPMMTRLEEHLAELVESDIIEKVEGPTTWVSPVVIVPKSNNKIRLCIDMRLANTAVVRQHYPVPTVDELLRDMSVSQFFSKIDLKMGFYQFILSPESRDITTFSTHVGTYRYKRLMFGISAAPEIYQREVANIISGITGVANLADDIIIHGKSKAEHDERLLSTLARLEAAGMTLNREKCVFDARRIDFLGHRISNKGVDPGLSKVTAITESTVPKTVMELKSFLGLVGYCSKFIPFFSDKTEPLRRLTLGASSNTYITMKNDELQAFNQLKKDLSDSTTLAYFDVSKETVLYTDASPVGLGAILIQYHDGEPCVVCYVSRALTDVETRYMQAEKEALAIVWACERLHHYLFGVRFTLLTDHQALEVIYGSKTKRTSLRIERWVLRLQSYDFEVKYVKGVDNIADPLSRLIRVAKSSAESQQTSEDTELYVRQIVLSNVTAVTAKDVEQISFVDQELSRVRDALETNRFDLLPPEVPKVYRSIRDELCVIGKVLLRGNRIVMPQLLRERVIELGHEGHLGIVGTKNNLRSRV